MSTFSAFRSATTELSVKSTLGVGGVRPTSLVQHTRNYSHSQLSSSRSRIQSQLQLQSNLIQIQSQQQQCRHFHVSSTTSGAWVKNAQPERTSKPTDWKERERKLKEIGLRGRAIPYKKVQVVTADGGISPFKDLQQVLQQVETMNWNAEKELQLQQLQQNQNQGLLSSLFSTAINSTLKSTINAEEEEGGGGIKKPKPRYHIQLIDNTTTPIVKIIDSKASYNKQKKAQEKAKNNASNNIQKEVQMTWYSSEADVENKLIKVKEELEKGNKVNLVIMPKKRMKTPLPNERQERLDEISKKFVGIGKEWKPRDLTKANGIIYFQSTVPTATQTSSKARAATATVTATVDVKEDLDNLPKNVREKLARKEKERERLEKKKQRDALLYGEPPKQ